MGFRGKDDGMGDMDDFPYFYGIYSTPLLPSPSFPVDAVRENMID
jgi:hypothetical protein